MANPHPKKGKKISLNGLGGTRKQGPPVFVAHPDGRRGVLAGNKVKVDGGELVDAKGWRMVFLLD